MDLSAIEIVLVGVIAFLVLGPEEFIKKSKQAGQFFRRMKTYASNFRTIVEAEINLKDLNEADEKTKSKEMSQPGEKSEPEDDRHD